MASETKVAEIFESVKQWGRWGTDDERGALNLLTAERVKAAAGLVQTGVTVSCAHDLGTVPSVEDQTPPQHMMLMAGDSPEASGVPGYAQSTDYLGMACHGMGVSHIDALCHVFVGDQMYNGFASSDVKSTGAMKNSIAAAAGGIVGRGVLLDIPRLRGVDWIEPPDSIGPDELAAAAAAQGSAVGSGDILLVATGRDARRAAQGPWSPFDPGLAGLHRDCIPWLKQADISVLGSDGISDPLPPHGEFGWPFPVHQCCIAGMGVHLLDNLDLLGLSGACRQAGRFEFLFSVQPLRAPLATGSPVNPVAVL
ncbi:MAG TPA: cyclase family protein [Acidimicrobiales bacterium]